MKRLRWRPSTPATSLVLAILLLPSGYAFGDLYEWVDKNGTVGYADSLEKVPPEYRAWAYHNRKKVEERPAPSAPAQPQPADATDTAPSTSVQDPFADWKERITKARAELDNLKAQREKARSAHGNILSQWRVRGSRLDPEKETQAAAAVKELDQRIQDKEYEITTTIPEQARRAGVPPGVLSQ